MYKILPQIASDSAEAIRSLFASMQAAPETQAQYQLPVLVLIGDMCSDKDLVLEKLIRRQLMPKKGINCPVKICVNMVDSRGGGGDSNKVVRGGVTMASGSDERICEVLTSIMDNGYVNYLSEEVITVYITEPTVPQMELHNLPSIQTNPPEAATMSADIVRKHLTGPHKLVICCVAATRPVLTSCRAISMVQDQNLLSKCVLVLTLCDRVQFDDTKKLVVSRICRKENKMPNFDKVVGVTSRGSYAEEKWFTALIDEHQSGADGVVLAANTTGKGLIRVVGDKYSTYIKDVWGPDALKTNWTMIESIRVSTDSIGAELTGHQLQDLFYENMSPAIVQRQLVVCMFSDDELHGHFDVVGSPHKGPSIIGYSEYDADIREPIRCVALRMARHIGTVYSLAFDKEVKTPASISSHPLNLKRYMKFRSAVVKSYVEEIEAITNDVTINRIAAAMNARVEAGEEIHFNLVRALLKYHIVDRIKGRFLPQSWEELAVEDELTTEHRASLNAELDQLRAQRSAIKALV